MIRNLVPALSLGLLAAWANLGRVHAHSGEIHIAGLSGGVSLAVLLVAWGVGFFFFGLFVWKWRQSVAATTGTGEDNAGPPDNNSGDG